jgi:TM2 domain-containing membrane protein YozV
VNNFEIEAIALNSIKKSSVKPEVIGDFKSGAILYFVLGVLSIWFLIGFLFIALGIAAWNTKIYKYILENEQRKTPFQF